MNIKFDGIYSDQLLSMFKGFDEVTAVGFDFFAKSFNFIQEYRFLELIEAHYNSEMRYFLHFQNEKKIIIEKILFDLDKLLSKKSGTSFPMNQILLEFSGVTDFHILDDLEHAYYVYFDHDISIMTYDKARYLKGIIFDSQFFNLVHNSGEWHIFYDWFKEKLLPVIEKKRLKLILKRGWNDNVFPSLLDSIPFNYINVEMNRDVEVGYRQPNIEFIKQQLKHLIQEVSE
jgi:hypothetical protein